MIQTQTQAPQRHFKILNDPVYGFVKVPYGILYDLIEHPYFQRLRRIAQLGMVSLVYAGALHTRFQHAIGALHLMTLTLDTLRQKGIEITDTEYEAAQIAILLHDIGHSPFSHNLEHRIVGLHHEVISQAFMYALNEEFGGKLTTAIQIFEDKYPKKFLHQLVSGQLDMDRMDYLNRDCFFTGVSEGVIGYDRIISMLSVQNGELVVEEKGIYSIEKFLIARRLMYWQVYLHKTVISAGNMLIKAIERVRELLKKGIDVEMSPNLKVFLKNEIPTNTPQETRKMLVHFALLDDIDVVSSLKMWITSEDKILQFLAHGLVYRQLLGCQLQNEPFNQNFMLPYSNTHIENEEERHYLIFGGEASNAAYVQNKDEIKIWFKNGEVQPMSTSPDYELQAHTVKKYFVCYPKFKQLKTTF